MEGNYQSGAPSQERRPSLSQEATLLDRNTGAATGLIASQSDDVFHPTHHGAVSSTFVLPHVPQARFVANRGAYIQQQPPFTPSSPIQRPQTLPPALFHLHKPHSVVSPPFPVNIGYNNPPHLQPQPNVPPPVFAPQPQHIPQVPFQQNSPASQFGYPPFPSYPYPYPYPYPYAFNPVPNNVPAASPIPPSNPPAPRPLPSCASIHILHDRSDFDAWDAGVCMVLRQQGLLGHILDPTVIPADPTDPDTVPAIRPTLSATPSQAEQSALRSWRDNEATAQYIIGSRVGTIPRQILPSALNQRTARDMYETLRRCYGLHTFSDCTETANGLLTSRCEPGRLQQHLGRWRAGLARLRAANYPFSVRVFIDAFVKSLPHSPTFNALRAELPDRLNAVVDDVDLQHFEQVVFRVLALDNAFRNTQGTMRSQRQAPASTSSVQSAPALPVAQGKPATPLDPNTSTADVVCSNCGKKGHHAATCFKKGGGLEGRRDEYMKNRGNVQAMLAAWIDSAFEVEDPGSLQSADPPDVAPALPDTLDGELVAPMAALTVSPSSVPNEYFYEPWFPVCDPDESSSPSAYMAPSEPIAFMSFAQRFNSALDSACTHYLIKDRNLFSNYSPTQVPVGTANCGVLNAIGKGDVVFRAPFRESLVHIILVGCLHTPDVPINLISVGALVERGLKVEFIPATAAQKETTIVSYPVDHPRLPSFSLHADVVRRLSLLNLDFVPASDIPSSVSSVVFSAFTIPRAEVSSMLWHRRFGHLGMDSTRAALTKDYIRGANFTGTFSHDKCIACLIGKSPHLPYSALGRRATQIGELLHMDLCGPFPVTGPHGETHFSVILDDCSNMGFTSGLRRKNQALAHFKSTQAFLERSTSTKVKSLRVDGAPELVKGAMGEYLSSVGIAVQETVPYAHPQNGKAERYVRTLEEGGQTLLADSGLPMSFIFDAILTHQYVRNRMPTSTLPQNTTPFEVFTQKKPDVSHFRVWGCQCFVAVPDELRRKAGFKRFEAIFVGYEEHRLGWRVRDLKGKYHFSRDVIFNEDLSGRLGVPRSIPPTPDSAPAPEPSPRPTRLRVRTLAGQNYDDVMRLKAFRATTRENRRLLRSNVGDTALEDVAPVNGGEVAVGDHALVDGGAMLSVDVVLENGGAVGHIHAARASGGGSDVVDGVQVGDKAAMSPDMTPSAALAIVDPSCDADVIADVIAFLAPSFFPDLISTSSLDDYEASVLSTFACLGNSPVSFLASSSTFNLKKPPFSYSDALARPDADVWRAAMDREMASLSEMGAFEETDLPPGTKAVGLKWVYDYKTDTNGDIIRGKEKARLVAQGFTQRPGQFDETYAPVAKMTSVRIILAWAAQRDLEIFQFDCKTAFLHAKLRHPNFANPFPGYRPTQPGKVLRILVALYGLRQSAYEFYMLFLSLLLSLGMVRCEVDHGVFYGEWSSPPDPSIPMPDDGSPLVLIVPLHVDDGLGATNSKPLYLWFIASLSKRLHIVDLGPCSKFLSILLIRDRPNRRIWLSSRIYIAELLDEWHMADCKPATTPFPSKLLENLPPNALPDVADAELTTKFQRLVGCLLYLAITTRPDIAYYAMWLGQFNSKPTRAHFLAAKHVLRYLSGTRDLALCLGNQTSNYPDSFRGFIQNVGCSDADWASDATDRKSISGYAFFFAGSLVSWSAVKQKTIALSSTEAEYYAMTHAFKEALWLRSFLGLLKLPIPSPYPLLCDNQATCALSQTSSVSSRSKHIDIRHHFIRNLIIDGCFTTTWIPTEDMPADIFTKVLPSYTFLRHRDVLGLSLPP